MLIQLLLKQIFALMGYVTNTNSFPKQLSSKEEEKLLEMYKNGDESAKNKLIEHNLRLVAHIAKKYTGIFKDGDDAVSIGTIGLIKGISSYNFDKKTKETRRRRIFFLVREIFFSREGYISPSRGKLYKGTLGVQKGLFGFLTIQRCFSVKFLIY